MIPTIEIDDEDIIHLEAILEIEDNDFIYLIDTLRNSEASLRRETFAENVKLKLKKFNSDEIQLILSTAFKMYKTLENSSIPITPQDLVEAICRAYSHKIERNHQTVVENKTFDFLRLRLNNLLTIKSLLVTEKAISILESTERHLTSIKIISDIRPVFSTEIEANASLIIHNLSLEFQDKNADDKRTLYFSMTTSQLVEFKNIICRAENKTSALRAIIENSDTTYLDA